MTDRPPLPIDPGAPFAWRDGERWIHFGAGAAGHAAELVERPFTLLTTPRAAAAVPELVEAASARHDVPAGPVDVLAASLRASVEGELLVALGGGRVIDVAKALAAADPPRRVAAVPTTLSGAELTSLHRHAAGVDPATPRVRPALVVADPSLTTSQPPQPRAASALNALAHGFEAALVPGASPVAILAAHAGARLIVDALRAAGTAQRPAHGPRDALALGALLASYALDVTGYGLHHVAAQSLVRTAGVSHGIANAVLLPHTAAALAARAPDAAARLAAALHEDPAQAAASLVALTGVRGLRDLRVGPEQIDAAVAAAAQRPELGHIPPPPPEAELRAIYAAAR